MVEEVPQFKTHTDELFDMALTLNRREERSHWGKLTDGLQGMSVGGRIVEYKASHEPVFTSFDKVTAEFERLRAESEAHKITDSETIDLFELLKKKFGDDVGGIDDLKERIQKQHESIEHEIVVKLARMVLEDSKTVYVRKHVLNETDDPSEIGKTIPNFIEWC